MNAFKIIFSWLGKLTVFILAGILVLNWNFEKVLNKLAKNVRFTEHLGQNQAMAAHIDLSNVSGCSTPACATASCSQYVPSCSQYVPSCAQTVSTCGNYVDICGSPACWQAVDTCSASQDSCGQTVDTCGHTADTCTQDACATNTCTAFSCSIETPEIDQIIIS